MGPGYRPPERGRRARLEPRGCNEAVASFQACIQRAPDDAQAYLGLAQTYEKMGELEEASRAFHRVLDLDPHNAFAKTGLEALR